MNRPIRLLAVMATTALLLSAMPASADTVNKSDPRGDAIPRLDITSATYTNGPGEVRGRLRVPELERLGNARLTIGAPASDVAYVASVTIDSSGAVSKRFSWNTSVSNVAKPCAFRVEWRAAEGYIKLSVPHSCLKNLDTQRPLYIFGRTGKGSNIDYGPVAGHLARG